MHGSTLQGPAGYTWWFSVPVVVRTSLIATIVYSTWGGHSAIPLWEHENMGSRLYNQPCNYIETNGTLGISTPKPLRRCTTATAVNIVIHGKAGLQEGVSF